MLGCIDAAALPYGIRLQMHTRVPFPHFFHCPLLGGVRLWQAVLVSALLIRAHSHVCRPSAAACTCRWLQTYLTQWSI